MKVRRGEPRDAEMIVALEADIFGAEAWSPGQVSAELSAPTHVVLVAEHEESVVGYGCLSVAGDVADLLRIAVDSSRRRTGLASHLLAALEVEAAKVGAVRVLLEVASSNVGAQAFYAAGGYAEISRRRSYYADGDDAIVMRHA
jgi:ribosomal-protein-alanine N-acetyltransferase